MWWWAILIFNAGQNMIAWHGISLYWINLGFVQGKIDQPNHRGSRCILSCFFPPTGTWTNSKLVGQWGKCQKWCLGRFIWWDFPQTDNGNLPENWAKLFIIHSQDFYSQPPLPLLCALRCLEKRRRIGRAAFLRQATCQIYWGITETNLEEGPGGRTYKTLFASMEIISSVLTR